MHVSNQGWKMLVAFPIDFHCLLFQSLGLNMLATTPPVTFTSSEGESPAVQMYQVPEKRDNGE